MPRKYEFVRLSEDEYEIREDGFFLLICKKSTFREDLEEFAHRFGRSSNWIGSLRRLLWKAYPSLPVVPSYISDHKKRLSLEKKIELLRSIGLYVWPKDVPPIVEVMREVQEEGYNVEAFTPFIGLGAEVGHVWN